MFDNQWAIVYTACGNFAGHISLEKDHSVVLSPAFIWVNEVAVVSGRIEPVRQLMSIQPSIEASTLEIEYIGIQRIKDWPERDQQEFTNTVEKTIERMKTYSARKAGLVI